MIRWHRSTTYLATGCQFAFYPTIAIVARQTYSLTETEYVMSGQRMDLVKFLRHMHSTAACAPPPVVAARRETTAATAIWAGDFSEWISFGVWGATAKLDDPTASSAPLRPRGNI